jgi:inosine-uridine nucleoside N-ribohydrolase
LDLFLDGDFETLDVISLLDVVTLDKIDLDNLSTCFGDVLILNTQS